MIKTFRKVKQTFSKIVNSLPLYKARKNIKTTELLGDLCLIRAELNSEINYFSDKLENTFFIFNTHKTSVNELDRLYNLQTQLIESSRKIEILINENTLTTKKIISLKNNSFINNADVEKGINSSISRANKLIETFEILSDKINSINLVKTA